MKGFPPLKTASIEAAGVENGPQAVPIRCCGAIYKVKRVFRGSYYRNKGTQDNIITIDLSACTPQAFLSCGKDRCGCWCGHQMVCYAPLRS